MKESRETKGKVKKGNELEKAERRDKMIGI